MERRILTVLRAMKSCAAFCELDMPVAARRAVANSVGVRRAHPDAGRLRGPRDRRAYAIASPASQRPLTRRRPTSRVVAHDALGPGRNDPGVFLAEGRAQRAPMQSCSRAYAEPISETSLARPCWALSTPAAIAVRTCASRFYEGAFKVKAGERSSGGERGLVLAEKPMSPLATDEILVYRAVEHAIRTGQKTAILTRDHAIEEQFFKLTYMVAGHYKAMLCAEEYARDFASFRTIPVYERLRDDDWWPLLDGGAILVDATRWGPSQETVLPVDYTFVGISCINTGPVESQMAFGAERGMARLLDVKDRTRGRSTEELGSRNLHVLVPENMRPDDGCSYVLVARDIAVKLFDGRADVPWLDVGHALTSDERPREVRYATAPRIAIPHRSAPPPSSPVEVFGRLQA
jgi:hypothetical protein